MDLAQKLLPKPCFEIYLDISSKQIDMEEKGKDISVLGRALSNLPNLEGNTITSERASLSDRPGENQES